MTNSKTAMYGLPTVLLTILQTELAISYYYQRPTTTHLQQNSHQGSLERINTSLHRFLIPRAGLQSDVG